MSRTRRRIPVEIDRDTDRYVWHERDWGWGGSRGQRRAHRRTRQDARQRARRRELRESLQDARDQE